jgi:signal transduction histidine kinase
MLNTITSEMQGIVRGTQQIVYQHEGQTEVLLDSTLLRNIVINLLSNAIKFSYDNGIIHIYSENLNGKVVVRVVDNGIGMSEDDQQHLFERFFRGANVTNIQGTGLGLHIVSKYVELMNGQIQCSSVLEEGTTFTITFTSN